MKTYQLYITIIITALCTSCKENEHILFNSQAGVYFQLFEKPDLIHLDSMMYSFAIGIKTQDTAYLNVRITGDAVDYDRYFEVSVVDEQTTANLEEDYLPLAQNFLLPANSFTGSVPVVLFNSEKLSKESIKLVLQIEESDDFNIGLIEKQQARLIISDQLVKSPIWDRQLFWYFGIYSRIKHKIYLDFFDEELPQAFDEIVSDGLYRSRGQILNNYFIENYPVLDENGVTIEPWL